ncbi:hypothetical protein BV25DRAFT_285003 [Artomyces pyxidatus]|uniref:Uncharacterized protein n=1 Tax=Artomyces pyxidatus TaxID=48021 RepID=A0ACB8SGX3_9AGAM|nr:hypothetical protein BV25DRAFT_285003 [Artomyces pyxidatus]
MSTVSSTSNESNLPSPPTRSSSVALFSPTEGGVYRDEDQAICLSQQPLDGLPLYLRNGGMKGFTAPLLHYGWMVDSEILIQFVLDNCPSAIVMSSQTFDEHQQLDVSWTLSTDYIIPSILKCLGAPNSPKIKIKVLFDSQGRENWGIVVGNNYTGVIGEESRAKLCEAFAPGQKGRWFLDIFRWKWTPKTTRRATKSLHLSPASLTSS